jgi:hypothetical protein
VGYTYPISKKDNEVSLLLAVVIIAILVLVLGESHKLAWAALGV